MSIFRLTPRIQSSQLVILSQFHKLSPALYSSSSSKDESLSSGESKADPKPKKNKEAVNKLNELLQSMKKADNLVSSSKIDMHLAKPPVKPKKQKTTMITTVDPLHEAAKKVAESLGGDVKQTEMDIMSKLLAEESAKHGKGSKKSGNWREVISGMKVDKGKETEEMEGGRAQQVRTILERQNREFGRGPSTFRSILREQQQSSRGQSVRVDIFGGRPLNIFKDVPSEAKEADLSELSTWKKLVSRELRLAATQPPANIYEEMILWTEQGKLWHFPIDNERGMEDEKMTYFTEHVFLERHIESWCPKKGALRHFMELVCVGLSKNPYITVEMKLEHINWFRDYFENKKQVIEAAEAALALAAANSEVESKENL